MLTFSIIFMNLLPPANAVTPTIVATITVGNSPTGVSVNTATNTIYVASQNSNTLSVINGTTNTVVTTITVGDRPLYVGLIGVNAATDKIYVANYNDNTVSVIMGSNNTVVKTISVGTNPVGVAVNTMTNKIYVSNYGSNSVSVINGNTDTVINTITVGAGPSGLAVNESTGTIYSVNSIPGTLSVINGTSDSVTNTIAVGGIDPQAAVVYAPTNMIYVTIPTSGIAVINGTTNTVVTTIPLTNSAGGGIAIDTATDTIVLGNQTNGTVYAIDGTTNSIVNKMNEGGSPDYVGENSVTHLTYFSNIASNTVTVITGLAVTPSETNNIPPLITSITVPVNPVVINSEFSVSASFTDANTEDTHTAIINWGNGTTTSAMISESGGSGTVFASTSYPSQGVYTITFTLMDDDGASTSLESIQSIVVYDPNGSYITGGGWINSPPGASTVFPIATGKATFGFVSKYLQGTNVPTGNTQFTFQAASLDFHSTSYQWLVVSGNKGQFKGYGTINNQGNYGFLLTSIDGDLVNPPTLDKFRIKIWDAASSNIVYDNQISSPDSADPTTVIAAGNIIIHKS